VHVIGGTMANATPISLIRKSTMAELLLYLALGLAGGFLAGLLGIGGGFVVVPGLLAVFVAHHLPESMAMPLAVGTSLATILFTSVSSVRAHHARAAVDWRVLRRMAPGVAVGAGLGATLAGHVPSEGLKTVFAIYAAVVATQMLLGRNAGGKRALPGSFGLSSAGGVIGGLSAMVGVGGATLSVPYLLWCRVPMRTAIGTASAMGFPIAMAGAAVYVLSGLKMNELPPLSVGFVYLPALAGVVVSSIVTAPLGAQVSHQLPVIALRRAFAVVLYVVAARMLPVHF
jgi:uncharacterized membrane protein YfcA